MNVKILVLLFLYETFLTVNSFTNVMVDGGSIQINNDVINCDGMMCTLDAFECKIEQITTKDLKEIETVKNCLSRKGRVLSREVKRRLNPIPGEKVYALSSADKDGNVRQMDNNGNYFKSPTPEEVNNFVNQQLENSQKLTQNILANVQETLQNIGIG